MLLMFEQGIRGGIFHRIYRNGKANNRYIKNYHKNKEPSYTQNLDEWIIYMDGQCLKSYLQMALNGKENISNPLHNLHNDLPCLPERMKIKNCGKLVWNQYGKQELETSIGALKQALNYRFIFDKSANQEAWLKSYIDINTKLRTETKSHFQKILFKLMNNAVFRKTMENVREHRDTKLVTTDKERSRLVSKPNYHTTWFSEGLLAIEMKTIK